MIAAGSVLTFDARGTAGGWIPATEDGTRADIIAALGDYFTVQAVTINGQGAFYELMEWQFVARIVVKPHSSYGALADVEAMIAHAIYEATGYPATVGAAGSQGASSGGGIVDTIVGAITDGIRDVGTAVGQGVGAAAKPVTDQINFMLIAVAIVAVVLIVNVGGKTTRVGLG